MRKFIIFITFIIVIIFISPSVVLAAKPRVRPAGVVSAPGLAIASARLRSDRLAVIVTFLNLNQLSDVSYVLTYSANGVGQGVQGSIVPSGTSTSRELLFGTCSKNVCTYHRGISNMRLVVTAQTTSGKTLVKKFRIKP